MPHPGTRFLPPYPGGATLQEMVRSAQSTLAMAKGNELLEPSIPQLQQALSAF